MSDERAKRVLVPLAPGFEEIEAMAIVDVLRRAGIEVVVAGTSAGAIEGSRGVRVVPDETLDEVGAQRFDAIALPGGGPGSRNLREDPRVLRALQAHHAAGRLTGAICAAPTVLLRAGLAANRRLTAHPSVQAELAGGGARVAAADRVVVDGMLVTSQGPGTAIEFAFKLVELLCGPQKVAELNAAMLARV
jgi:4-methyl-5(b-hydroxyethyl)-thiazole monophosphate biosynthesis